MLESVTKPGPKTVDDLIALGEDTRVELIHGEFFDKEQELAPVEDHARPQLLLGAWVARRFNRAPGGRWPGGWWFATELHVRYTTKNVFCHDLVGYRLERKPPGGGFPLETRPDWVCELISPGHARRDRVAKLNVLQACGVPHYWLLDHREGILQIFRHEPAGYLLVGTASPGETIRAKPFDAVELRTDVIFGLADDEE